MIDPLDAHHRAKKKAKKKAMPKKPPFADRWLADFRDAKSDWLGLVFGQASDYEKEIANIAFKIEFGLSTQPDVYRKLIKWARKNTQPKGLDVSDMMHLSEQRMLSEHSDRPSDAVFQALGLPLPKESPKIHLEDGFRNIIK